MSIIDDGSELDRILETHNFDDYELIDIPMESDESLHELTCVGMAPASNTPSTSWLAPCKGSSRELRPGVDPCQGYSVFSLVCPCLYVCSNVPENQSRKFEPQNFMLTSRVDISQKCTPSKISHYTVLEWDKSGKLEQRWDGIVCISNNRKGSNVIHVP